MLDIEKLRNTWEREEPIFIQIAKYSIGLLKSKITHNNIKIEITFRTKELLSIIKKVKKKSREESGYSYESVTDKLGIRIVCAFYNELEAIEAVINELFTVLKRDVKRENFKFNSLEYLSNHYDVCLKSGGKWLKNIERPSDYIFEIQVRTINQDAWAKMSHKLSYKNEQEISEELKRSIYRLLALYELADEEFNRVNQRLQRQPENKVNALIRNLEKYVYRYTHADFDREISEFYIEKILNYFGDKDTAILLTEVEEFIINKEDSIIEVYRQEDIKQSEHFWLTTQPEVFLIWFCIDNHYYLIRDNWSDYFDFEEFEFLATIWGKSVN